TGETVLSVKRNGDGVFTVTSSKGEHHAARVILAIGRRGVPRKLGVPGEDSAAVAYSLREPEALQDDRIVVVGGGDSAIEAALALADQPGNRVWLSYRGEKFSRIKEENRQRIEHAVGAGQVEVLWSTQLTRIEAGAVHYRTAGGDERVLDADRVFVFIGGELPTRFLRECGVEIDVKFGTPYRSAPYACAAFALGSHARARGSRAQFEVNGSSAPRGLCRPPRGRGPVPLPCAGLCRGSSSHGLVAGLRRHRNALRRNNLGRGGAVGSVPLPTPHGRPSVQAPLPQHRTGGSDHGCVPSESGGRVRPAVAARGHCMLGRDRGGGPRRRQHQAVGAGACAGRPRSGVRLGRAR